jgi:hypothetical protein
MLSNTADNNPNPKTLAGKGLGLVDRHKGREGDQNDKKCRTFGGLSKDTPLGRANCRRGENGYPKADPSVFSSPRNRPLLTTLTATTVVRIVKTIRTRTRSLCTSENAPRMTGDSLCC